MRIVFVGESYVPDFNQFDCAIGFDDLTFGDRYLRIPLFAFYGDFRKLCSLPPLAPADKGALLNRGFCSFVVSNEDGDPARIEFFRRLSKYRPVASGGKILNNVGGRVPDKSAFIAKYKFNIAFENSVVPGYTTEKVMEPLAVRSVPIYYGNPDIAADFDPACMVRVASRDDMDRAGGSPSGAPRTTRTDGQTSAPKASRDRPRHPGRDGRSPRLRIFDQPLDAARRLNGYGYQTNIRHRADRARKFYLWTHPGKLLKKVRCCHV